MSPISFFADLPPAIRIIVIVAVAVLGHFLVQFARSSAERVLARAGDPTLAAKAAVAKRYPKFATITSLAVSALTFLIYFGAVGLVLHEVFPRLNLATYLATASVMGLAVAFGLQGLIQDIVIGLTLVFSDAAGSLRHRPWLHHLHCLYCPRNFPLCSSRIRTSLNIVGSKPAGPLMFTRSLHLKAVAHELQGPAFLRHDSHD
jgi:hypothetical protein